MWQSGNRGSKQNTNYWCCEIYFYGHTNNNCDYDNNNNDNGKKKTLKQIRPQTSLDYCSA